MMHVLLNNELTPGARILWVYLNSQESRTVVANRSDLCKVFNKSLPTLNSWVKELQKADVMTFTYDDEAHLGTYTAK